MVGLGLLGGCGGGSVPPAGDGLPVVSAYSALAQPLGVESGACALTLNKSQAGFGEVLTLTGWPSGFGEPGLRILASDGKSQYVHAGLFKKDGSSGGFSFVAPIHPITPLAGGTVSLEVGDGAQRCPAISLEVAAVPDADPQIAMRVYQKLTEWLDLSIAQLGASAAQLATATPGTVQPDLIPFAVAKRILATNGDLAQEAQAALDSQNKVLAGIIQGSQWESQLDAAIAELKALPAPGASRETLKSLALRPTATGQALAVAPDRLKPQVASAAVLRTLEKPRAGALCDGQQFPPNPLSISTAADLSRHMLAAKKGYAIGSAEQTKLGQLLGSYSLAGVADTNFAGKGLLVMKTVEDARRALEPTEITAFDVGRYDSLLIEDRPAAQPGRWDSAVVTARGQSFNVSPAILDGLITFVGLPTGPVAKAMEIGGTVFANQWNNVVNDLTEGSCIRIEAPSYGPVSVADEEWTEFTVIGDAVRKLSQRTYMGQAIGAAELQVKLRTEKFGSAAILQERRNVVVQEQQVTSVPGQVRVNEPGEVVDIAGTIPNSFAGKANLQAAITRGGGVSGAEIISRRTEGDFHTVKVRTPVERGVYPIHVTFTSLNPTLPANSPRTVTAVIDLKGSLSLSSPASCLVPGTEFGVTATLAGFANGQRVLNWSVTGAGQWVGTPVVNADGTQVTATVRATGTGSLEIKATSAADPSVSATVTTSVSDRCLVKTLAAGLGVSGAVSGQDSDGSAGCVSAVSAPGFEEKFQTTENPTPLPAIPPEAERWMDRSGSVVVQNRSATVSVQRGNANGTACNVATVNSNVNAQTRVYGAVDGTLGFDMDVDLQGSCAQIDNAGNPEVFCAGSQSVASVIGAHYLDIDRDTTVRVEGELSCQGLQGVFAFTPMSLIASRYEPSGSGLVAYVPSQLSESLIADAAGNPLPPVLWTDFTCTSANQTASLSKVFVFKKPRQAGKTDRIIFTSMGNAMALVTGTQRSGFGPFGQEPGDLARPVVGDHRTRGKVMFKVQVKPQ